MRRMLLVSLIGAILGADLYGDRPTVAEPAPVFQPIVREIRARLPADFKMRLPASLPKFTQDLPLFAFVSDDDVQIIDLGGKDVFSVLISDIPGCDTAEDPSECVVGIIGVTEALSQSALKPDDLPDDAEDLTPVTLAEAAKGYYFVQDRQAQFVVWSQDDLGYLLFSGKCEDECASKEQMIAIARSAANEPVITSFNSRSAQ